MRPQYDVACLCYFPVSWNFVWIGSPLFWETFELLSPLFQNHSQRNKSQQHPSPEVTICPCSKYKLEFPPNSHLPFTLSLWLGSCPSLRDPIRSNFLIANCGNWRICVTLSRPHKGATTMFQKLIFNSHNHHSFSTQSTLRHPLHPPPSTQTVIYLFIYIPSLCWRWISPGLPRANSTVAVIHDYQLPRGH